MSPELQASLSQKYIPRPLTIIPVGSDLFHVYEAYGADRRFLLELPSAELPAWLADDFQTRLASNLTSLASPVRQRSLPASLFSLADLDLGL